MCVAVEAKRVVVAEVLLHTARGVENEQIERTKLVDRRLHEAVEILFVREVGAHGDGATAGLFDFFHDLVRPRRLLTIVDDDVVAFRGENLRGVSTHASRRTCDDGGFCGGHE